MDIIKKTEITISKDVEKKEHSCTVDRKVNWCSHYEKQYEGFSKKIKIGLPYDSVVPLLSIYPKK